MTRLLAKDRANPAASPRRRFGWADVLILLVATGLGVAMGRQVYFEMVDPDLAMMLHYTPPHGLRLWRRVLAPVLTCWTLALIPLLLLGPRPRRLSRTPGFATVLVVAIMAVRALVDRELWSVVNDLLGTNPFGPFPYSLAGTISIYPNSLVNNADSAGFTIAAVWACLGMCRWWRPDPRRADRAGLALGYAWIAMSAASCCERAMN